MFVGSTGRSAPVGELLADGADSDMGRGGRLDGKLVLLSFDTRAALIIQTCYRHTLVKSMVEWTLRLVVSDPYKRLMVASWHSEWGESQHSSQHRCFTGSLELDLTTP